MLQTLYSTTGLSRADVARETGLTRVTVSDLVADLIDDGLIVEGGPTKRTGPGKPATVIEFASSSFGIIGIDLSGHSLFRGALMDLSGTVLLRVEVPLRGRTGTEALALVDELVDQLISAAEVPLLGIGVGSPGIVDLAGVVLAAPNLGWSDVPVQADLATRVGLPVVVANDANMATLAEHSFGGGASDMILVKIGHGVGSGLVVGGTAIYGSEFAAGEIGHVVVGDDGARCVCGKDGCLETRLATPRLDAALAETAAPAEHDAVLADAGRWLGVALAPVVGALNLTEVVLSGPVQLLDGPLVEALTDTLRARTMAEFHGAVGVRMTSLGEDIVLRGAAAMTLSRELGVS
ncbi:ROK family transcriptional regulator [Microbacterium dauci]|uniref:ROK family transcriptional regulator n=1 Tax=Microbacterium dauci TaxID=3048008 RepID=A0ABT6ZDB7_9MICO|nr:ROK family transcriptional regulator [Microbacterium sp. LX3-4]MDJ1114162.1 ROK family transcriptional regulator [Microbacterium sp. LX3-4]